MINSLCSICATGSIIARYIITLEWQHKRRLVLPLDNLITSGQYKILIMELVITVLAPNPGIQDYSFEEVYPDRGPLTLYIPYNDVLLVIAILFRIFFMLRFGLSFTKNMDSRTQRVC
jgi:hypothetical protein